MARRSPRTRTRYIRTASRRASKHIVSIAGGLNVINTVGHVLATPGGKNPISTAIAASKGQANFGTVAQELITNIKMGAMPIATGWAAQIAGAGACRMLGINTNIGKFGKYTLRAL